MDKRALFERAFGALTGNTPLSWQRRLFLEHFLHGEIPPALDIPTGLGKTSVIAIWYLALQAGAAIPRRLVYVVDRRVVVDQATTIADAIKCKLADSGLRVSTLRGQHLDNREWLADPIAPAIVVGTVDMIGSRLLFSGYGVSPKMRPYHAGLLGADALLVLDEAHLVPPFEALLTAIVRDRTNQFGPRSPEDRTILPCLRLMSLSATGRESIAEAGHSEPVFRLDADDECDPIVARRLKASKRLTIHDTFDEKTSLVDELAGHAWALGFSSKPARVLVYSHSRADAEKIKNAIDNRAKKEEIDAPSELLVGQRRVHEREQLLGWLKQHGFIEGPTEALASAILIATAAGEVGIDLDADHIVCDLVEWERMVQRLGRVNRRGSKQSQVEVIALPSKENRKEAEPWAERLKRLRAPLDLLPALYAGERDASPGAIMRLKAAPTNAAVFQCAQTPEPLRPALNRAHVDAWSMTSLEEHTGRPDIQPWLRGWEKDEPQTAIVWRGLLPVRIQNGRPREVSRKEINEFFEAAPPHLSEILETETWRAAEWLIARAKRAIAEVEKREKTKEAAPLSRDSVVLFVLNARDELDVDERKIGAALTLGHLAELGTKERDRERKAFIEGLEGRTLVVSAHLGGLKDGMLRDAQDAAPPAMDTDPGWDQRPFRVTETSEPKPTVDPGWQQSHRFVREIDEDGEATRWLIVDEWQGQAESEDSRALSRKKQTLKAHRERVEAIVRAFAQTSGLPAEYMDMLGLAARWHDEGKKQLRWRLAFAVPRGSEALAKTEHFRPSLLDGYRHEFGSLFYVERNADVQQDADFKKLAPDLRDLLLHLIAAHHGNARPLISAKNCEGAVTDLEACALEAALRFERLQKRWGPWGLAWWESLLRAADQTASREHEEFGEAKRNAEAGEAA